VKDFFIKPDRSLMLLLIQGCKRNDRESQRLLYQHYYGYAMSICIRYCKTKDEAQEVVNDGFMKIFQKIEQYKQDTSFKAWVRRIMINASIDHYRKELKHQKNRPLEDAYHSPSIGSAVDEMAYEELVGLIQKLTPAYRAVFNLYVIDGHTHEEIAEILGISDGTSKSNLMKARENLRKMLGKLTTVAYAKYV
jgi:RNA polymerase sigma-70 factor (ECF subfamily)